jgi:alpha-L-arabinofuranosidase
VNTLRYPGGGLADVCHWSVTRSTLGNANGYGTSPWDGVTNDYSYVGSQTDFGNYVKLLTNSQCQAVITVNYGSGQLWGSPGHTNLVVPGTNAEPPEAAAWVAYANANTNIFGTTNDIMLGVDSLGNDWKSAGYWAMMRAASQLGTDDGYNFLRLKRTAPLGIKYWEIGNEQFGTGYGSTTGNGYSVCYAVPYPYTTYPRYGNPSLSPEFYGQQVRQFSLLMKAVDPTLKIGAVGVNNSSSFYYTFNGPGVYWTPEVLAQCATNIDFLINHSYPYAGNLSDGTSMLSANYSYLQTMVNGTGNHTGQNEGLRDMINAVRADGANVQIFITEFAYTGTVTNSLNGEPIYGPVNGLLAADSYATWMELGVANMDWLEMNKNTFLGDGRPLVPGAAYYAIQLTHVMAAPGDTLVATTDDASSLNVHAAVQQSGKIGVMLLNENLTNSLSVNVTIPNVTLASSGTMYQFGTNNFTSANPLTPSTAPTTNPFAVSGNSVSVVVPPYTMAVLTIATNVAPTNPPPVLAAISNRTVNVGQTVAFTARATDTNQPPQTLTFALLAGTTNATLNSSSGAFSWCPLVTQANSSNNFSLQVSDNGKPVLSATQSFYVTVSPLTVPTLSAAMMANNQFKLSVSGQTGPDYEVQSSTNLTQWSAAFVTHSPALPLNWTDTNPTNIPTRFYRVVVGPPLP